MVTGSGKILIIDDSDDARMLAMARLKQQDYELFEACNGDEGIQLALKVLPDVILLDLNMPEKDGFTIIREMMNYPELMNIPVIFLSASSGGENKVKGLDLGAFDYITKPFDPYELRARVRVALRVKRLQDMLYDQAHLDPLTGVQNRRSFEALIKQEWDRFKRYGHHFSVIMIDIDHFKQVNDTYGHGIGDQVLQKMAKVVNQEKRHSDFFARYGGEEFIMVLPRQTLIETQKIAERLLQVIRKQELKTSQGLLKITCSMGLSEATEQCGWEEVVQQADQALYQAKAGGRNQAIAYLAQQQ